MRRRISFPLLVVALLTATSLALSVRGSALAQQGPQLSSLYADELPTDPASPAWANAPAVNVPLTPQAVALPRLTKPTVPTVAVRSLNNGQRIAFLLEWADDTRDAHATRPDQFRDAAAIMLPSGDFLPNICMGAPGQLTDLWHWKADWQEDLDKGFQDVVDAYPNFYKDSYPFVTGTAPYRVPTDFASAEARQYLVAQAAGNPFARFDRSSPVEELRASGFGYATHRDRQEVQGKGVWADGKWGVVFSRQLKPSDPDAAQLAPNAQVQAAFAVWNGSNQEVGARKQLSASVGLRIVGKPVVSPPPTPFPPVTPRPWGWEAVLGIVAVLLVGAAAGFGWWRGGQRGRAGGRGPTL